MAAAGALMQRARYTKMFVDRLPFMDEILFENFDAPSLTYPSVFNVRNSSRAYEEILGITGFSQFNEKLEGEPVTYDSLLQGYSKRFTHLTYAKGYQITTEAMDDDIDGAISDAAPALSRVARNSIETELYADFNGGFTSATVPDGKYIFDTDHPLVGGGTADNMITGDISQSTLESALNLYRDMRDDPNQLINMEARILLIHPNLQWIVHEILKSSQRSDTADNATNALSQIPLRVVMSKYLTNTTDWFLLSEPNLHRLMCYWRMSPLSDHTLDFDTGNMKTKMTYRLSHGAADWRGLVGGDGT